MIFTGILGDILGIIVFFKLFVGASEQKIVWIYIVWKKIGSAALHVFIKDIGCAYICLCFMRYCIIGHEFLGNDL